MKFYMMKKNHQTSRRKFAKSVGGITALSAGLSVPGLASVDFKSAYQQAIEKRKSNRWSVSAWRDHISDKGFSFKKRDNQGEFTSGGSGLSPEFNYDNSKLYLTFTTDYMTTSQPVIDFTYEVDNSSGLEEGNLPMDRVMIGYSDTHYVRSDYYTGSYTAKDKQRDCFGNGGSCLAYDDLSNYHDDKQSSTFSDFYGEYVKRVDGTDASMRKIYIDWRHTWGLFDLSGIGFSPMPSIQFEFGSDSWLKEDEAFESDL